MPFCVIIFAVMVISFIEKIVNRVRVRFGEGFFTVFGICAFLFILCGLAIGVLGRGWLYAWLLVILGAVFGFLPVANFLIERRDERLEEVPLDGRVVELDERELLRREFKERREASRDGLKKSGGESAEKPGGRSFDDGFEKTTGRSFSDGAERVDEATKAALELEAAIARARIRKEEEKRRAAREAEERYEADRAAYLARKQRQVQEAYEREAKKAAEERKRREEQNKKNREFNENFFRESNIKKAPKAGIADGYFKGVSNSAELKKRYKDLMKIYHPDNTAGDADVMRRIKAEYEELVVFYQAYDKH